MKNHDIFGDILIIVFRDNDIGKDIFFVINFFQGLSVKAFFDIDFRRGKVFLDFEDSLGSFFRKMEELR